MSDIYGAPAVRGVAVTPSDDTVLGCRAIYVGGAGNVAVQFVDGGSTITFTAPTVGAVLPVSAYRIMAATTATLLIALY